MQYNGGFEYANSQPDHENWIAIFASDWNKQIFAFYAHIEVENYEKDVEEIWELLEELNPDQDIYIELINHGDNAKALYDDFLESASKYTDQIVLETDEWEKRCQ